MQSTAFEGDQMQFIAMQQDMNCYGQVYPAYQAGFPFYSSSDTSICNPGNTGTTTGVGPGQTSIFASWTADAWLFTPTGDCDYTPAEVLRDAICEVLQCAVPRNFRKTAASDTGSGTLHVKYAWDSSTGNLSDLSQCTVDEKVDYNSADLPFQSPPFRAGLNPPNPTILPSPPIPGTEGLGQDDH